MVRTARSETPADGLRTVVDATPDALIRTTLERLREVAEADEAVFYRLSRGRERPLVSRWVHVGSERCRRGFGAFFDDPPVEMMRAVGSSVWDPSKIRAHEFEAFLERERLHDDRQWYESDFYNDILDPLGLDGQLRLVVRHGTRMVGWIGALRARGARPFDARARRALRPFVASIASRVCAVNRLDTLGDAAPGDLVVRPDGEVDFASPDGARWLAHRDFKEALRLRVRDLDRGADARRLFVLDGAAEAHAIRLDGASGVRYLVSVRPTEPLELPKAVALTAAERSVAELAAAGATVDLIAQERGTTVGTVRNQLKRIYRTLGVASRVELARALG